MDTLPPPLTEHDNLPAGETTDRTPNWTQIWREILEVVIPAIILAVGINLATARVRVEGFSMNPSLENDEYILVNKLAYKIGEPTRGDIIVFSFPLDPNQDLIKRVIGLPGETITVQNGQVSVDGAPLEEPYIAAAPFYNGTWVVTEGQLFVLGDNRNESKDSHEWGLLPMENVIGKAVVIYWPPPKWEVLDHFEQASAAQ